MLYLTMKAAVSGVIVAIASEIARRSPTLGALVVSLPLLSILTMVWLWRDTGDITRIADHAWATFWLVLPTLPMFLLMPALLRAGHSFWTSLLAGSVLTIGAYLVTMAVLPRVGISI